MDEIEVIKLHPSGEVAWCYRGQVIKRGDNWLTLQAPFDRDDISFFGIVLVTGDHFVETFYTDRWYNIFEIHDREDDHLKGWYCNVTMPATITEDQVSYIDLALDLLVFPDGKQVVLDEDEFSNLEINDDIRIRARLALGELQALDFQQGMR